MTTITYPNQSPKCPNCKKPIESFEVWFSDDCPASEPVTSGHHLTPEEWQTLPFGAKEQQP